MLMVVVAGFVILVVSREIVIVPVLSVDHCTILIITHILRAEPSEPSEPPPPPYERADGVSAVTSPGFRSGL